MPVPFQTAVMPGSLPTPGPVRSVIGRGSLVTFNYLFRKPGHDPSPLLLVTDIWDRYVRGLNLHYLTFPVIKSLLFPAGRSVNESPQITYQSIKGSPYVVSAFRQYKRAGVESLKKMDSQFIVNAMSISRSFDPSEIEAIRRSVRDQIRLMGNPQAAPAGEAPFG